MTEEIKVPDDLQPIYEAVSSGAMALGGHMAKEIIERIGSVEGILERTTDLVRFMRHELFDAELISDEEFAALAADGENGKRVTRLDSYDKARDAQTKALIALKEEVALMRKGCPFEEENIALKKELAAYKEALGRLLHLDCDQSQEQSVAAKAKRDSLLKSARYIVEVNPHLWDDSDGNPEKYREGEGAPDRTINPPPQNTVDNSKVPQGYTLQAVPGAKIQQVEVSDIDIDGVFGTQPGEKGV